VQGLPFGNSLNRLSFHAMRQMMWQSFKASDITARQQLGMRKGSFWGPWADFDRNAEPVLYGYSQYVLPRPSDWAANLHVTGYWFWEGPQTWTPPADLVEFLQAGPPPVYIGFGSMVNRNPQQVAQIALDALAISGQRGVVSAGWGGLDSSDLPPTVHAISQLPHSWLFPRMAAVVHHGGAGTTSAGLQAGVPSIIVPFMSEQAFWGRRVAQLGVGPRPIPRKQLSSASLAAAITEAVTNAAMQQRSADLGALIRTEDGIANAVAVVKKTLARNGQQPSHPRSPVGLSAE
jgi:sterol 3beta-glucosyltransferase